MPLTDVDKTYLRTRGLQLSEEAKAAMLRGDFEEHARLLAVSTPLLKAWNDSCEESARRHGYGPENFMGDIDADY
jgi:hypothetical protein